MRDIRRSSRTGTPWGALALLLLLPLLTACVVGVPVAAKTASPPPTIVRPTAAATPRQLQAIATLQGHTARVLALAWSPDGTILASGGWDSVIRLWRPDGSLFKTLPGHASYVAALAWSPDGRTLASGSFDKTIRLWGARDNSSSPRRTHRLGPGPGLVTGRADLGLGLG